MKRRLLVIRVSGTTGVNDLKEKECHVLPVKILLLPLFAQVKQDQNNSAEDDSGDERVEQRRIKSVLVNWSLSGHGSVVCLRTETSYNRSRDSDPGGVRGKRDRSVLKKWIHLFPTTCPKTYFDLRNGSWYHVVPRFLF